jgi:hypothetical protein
VGIDGLSGGGDPGVGGTKGRELNECNFTKSNGNGKSVSVILNKLNPIDKNHDILE